MNPITFYANSADTECGNGDCESGESSTTCCYDCFCSSGRYCDTGGSKDGVCKLESLIDLDVTQVSQTMFSNCNEEHDLFVTVKIINPPTNANIQSISYKLDADSYQTVSCEDLGNYYYRCPVTIPSFPFGSLPECSGTQSYTITGNSIKLVISYYDGPSQSTNQELYASFDDLIVGSYVCGNNQCETALGENAENCCYDCECPTNQYCDTESPVIGDMCRNELTNNDFAIISTEPENFETYKTSDKITITSKINDIPSTLTVSDTACSLGCVFSDETGQHVSNSEQSISDELSATSSGISIGSSFCGDGICDTTGLVESYDSCCYDCPCESGYYCDTQNTQGPSASDECKAEDDISLEINNINPSSLSFSDYSQENIIEFNAQIINPPSGMDYGYECTFGDGTEMPCNIDCDPDPDTSTEDLYNMSCSITIDPINNYESLSFYDSATDLITITPNNIDFSLTYNNGQNTDNKELSAVLGDINLVVLAHCGSGAGYRTYDSRCDPNDREAACETNLGENSETCCCDCGCPTGNEYCYYEPDDIGDYGTCSAADDIELVLIGISPDTATCCIDNYQVGCVFATMGGECASMENVQWNFNSAGDITMTNRITLRTKVTNPPPDLKLHFGNYYLEIDGEKQDGLTGVVCSEYPSAGHGHYKCEFVLDRIEDATIGSETKNVELFFTVEYTLGDQTVTKNLSTSTSFTIERAKTDILIEAEEEIDDINDKIDRMNIIKAVIYSVLAVGLAIVIGFCICCALPGTQPFCCSVCGWGMVLYACISSVLIGVLLALISHVNDLKVQKEALNAQIGKSSDAAESGMSTEQLAVMGSGVVFTIICFVGLFMGGGGGGSAATATSGSTGSGGAGTGSMAITSADEMAWDSWYITGPPAPP